jgi:Fe-S cluster assembly iron-binding protein IscA
VRTVLTLLQTTLVGVKSGGCSGLSYDLKFDKAKSEDDKIFIDEITIAVEKNLPISSRNNIRVLGGINGKGFIFNNPNAKELADVERVLFKTKSFESTI